MTRIAILGYGTIGKGVAKMIDLLKDKYDLKLAKVLDLPSKKDELGDLLAANIDEIANDESIDIVVEVLGGNDFAYMCTKKCLLAKKSVVTANKEVVSNNIKELYKLAQENGVNYLFEASVGGGIPLIRPLIENIKINDITSICGILNGTTNYMLTKMQEDGLTFAEALKLAQVNGFAEADPSADLKGLDMVRKISILTNIAYKTYIDPKNVYHYGIENVTKDILADIKSRGYVLRFVAQSSLVGNNVTVRVEPTLVKPTHPFASVCNEFNSCMLDCTTNDKILFYGKGAGSIPTATAVAGDIIQIVENKAFYEYNPVNDYEVNKLSNNGNMYYVVGDTSDIKPDLSDEELSKYKFYARIF